MDTPDMSSPTSQFLTCDILDSLRGAVAASNTHNRNRVLGFMKRRHCIYVVSMKHARDKYMTMRGMERG